MTPEDLRRDVRAAVKRRRDGLAALGLCIRCECPRGEDGTSKECRCCANKAKRAQARSRMRRAGQ